MELITPVYGYVEWRLEIWYDAYHNKQ